MQASLLEATGNVDGFKGVEFHLRKEAAIIRTKWNLRGLFNAFVLLTWT